MNDQEMQKIKGFVDHLLQIPNIKGEPILIGEGLILNFIVQNTEHLKTTFKTPQFFPHLEWNDVLQVLLSDLYERVENEAIPVFEKFIDSADFEVLNKISDGPNLPVNFQREKFHDYLNSIFKNKEVRYSFNSVLNIFKYNVIEKYLGEIFKRRDFLYNELVRVQKTHLEKEEYIIFMKVLLLIKNAAYLKIPIAPNDTAKVNLFDCQGQNKKQKQYIQEHARLIRQQLPSLSERTIELALKANLKNEHTEVEDASSRILFILVSRYHSYKPMAKVDRGAESPDKSWFGIMRKNPESNGFDRRLLDDLYRIAGDNNW